MVKYLEKRGATICNIVIKNNKISIIVVLLVSYVRWWQSESSCRRGPQDAAAVMTVIAGDVV